MTSPARTPAAPSTAPTFAPRRPDVDPWGWDHTLDIDGVAYRATKMDSPVEGFSFTRILHGLPARYRDAMLREAQQSPTPHAWRVGDELTDAQVTDDVMNAARELFRRDVEDYGNVFLTFLAEREGAPSGTGVATHVDGFDLIGCAAARRRIAPGFESQSWVVLGRLLAVSALRGKGFGVHFQFTFFGCSQTMCGIPALGNFMPTDTEQTRRLCRRAVETGALDMVEAGRKRWRLIDRVLDVEVFLAFYPGMRDWLRSRCEVARAAHRDGSPALQRLLDATDRALAQGYSHDGGRALGELLSAAEAELDARAATDVDLALYADFLHAARAMGTLE